MSKSYFFLRTDGLLKRINYADVLFLETADNYSKIHVTKGVYTVRISMKQVLAQLKDQGFVQVHRSFAVSVDHIELITKEFIVLTGEKEIQIPLHDKFISGLLKKIELLGPKGEEG